MNMRDLIPWGRERASAPSYQTSETSPFLTLHREMNRLFDDVFSRFDSAIPAPFGRMATWPSLEVSVTDNEVRITAELPGMEEKDVELAVKDDVLILRGEKKAQTEDAGRHFSERYYGVFERQIPLPFEVDEGRATATFENGVLTVTLPKSPRAEDKVKRIAIGSKSKDTQH